MIDLSKIEYKEYQSKQMAGLDIRAKLVIQVGQIISNQYLAQLDQDKINELKADIKIVLAKQITQHIYKDLQEPIFELMHFLALCPPNQEFPRDAYDKLEQTLKAILS